MKILLVTWYFPPSNQIGAFRLGGLARYLLANGHDVRVVTCKDPPYRQTLADDFPAERVARTKWLDVNALPKAIAKLRKGKDSPSMAAATSQSAPTAASQAPPGATGKLRASLKRAYVNIVNWPDRWIGWLPYALGSGRRLVKDWQPDVVFASAPPFTTLLAGAMLARKARAPLVLEFRDRWWDDPYYPPPAWLRAISRFAERRLMAGAVGLSTVSEPWAETYRARHGKPTVVMYNGYDAEILERIRSAGSAGPVQSEARLRIVYTGGIYPGRRDPKLLFAAIARLGEAGRAIEVAFYGTDPNLVLPLADAAGVRDNVSLHDEVNHEEAVARQCEADVLLLMQWDDPNEQGNVPGKFFEYIGSRRPILILGLREGVPATIARERQAGVYGESVEQIAGLLTGWLETKRREGSIPASPESACSGFSRHDQYRVLERFLESLTGDPVA